MVINLLTSLATALAALGLVAISVAAIRGLRLVGMVGVAMECTLFSCALVAIDVWILVLFVVLMGVEWMRSDDAFVIIMTLALARAALGLSLAAIRVLVL